MKNPFKRGEAKSFDVLPEDLWQRMIVAQDMAGGANVEQAVGLPAILAVIRLIAHAASQIPLDVIRGDGADRQKARDTWQWQLIHKRPAAPPTTPANFMADLAAHYNGFGNAYIRKLKPAVIVPRLTRDTPRVTELQVTHPGYMTPKRSPQTGAVLYVDTVGKETVERGTDEIIQVRSFSLGRDGLRGVSPISAARMMISAGLKREQFEDRHLSNGIFPGIAVSFPPSMTKEQGGDWLDFIEQRHRGSGKAGKAIGMPAGANLTTLPISLEDALFAEMTRITGEQACAMYQVPLAILNRSTRPITDDDWRHFNAFALSPVVTAVKQALEADDDLFRPGADDDLSLSADYDSLVPLDPEKKARVQHNQVQDGTRMVDELRAADGLAPLPPVPDDWTQTPGMVPQITPVGGAPNPTANTGDPEGGPSNGQE